LKMRNNCSVLKAGHELSLSLESRTQTLFISWSRTLTLLTLSLESRTRTLLSLSLEAGH
jgi:hypothetical protein